MTAAAATPATPPAALLSLLRMAPRRGLAALGIASMVGHVASQLALPWLGGRIIDGALGRGGALTLLHSCMMLAVVAATSVLFRGGSQLSFARWGEGGLAALKTRMFEHLNRVPLPYLEGEKAGRVHTLFNNDAVKVGRFFNPVAREVAYAVVEAVLLVTVLVWNYGSMALLGGALLPIYVVFPLFVARPVRAASRAAREAEAAESAAMAEAVSGVRDVKAFAREGWSMSLLAPVMDEGMRRRLRLVALNWVYGLDYVLYWSAVAVVYWLGGQRVLSGELTVGELVALVAYLGKLESPVSKVFGAHASLQALHGPLTSVREFLAVAPEAGGTARPALAGPPPAVELRDVSFTYPGADTPALRGVSLRVLPGQRVAVVGPSGAGKSTLIRLLLRFHDPDGGTVLLDGRALPEYEVDALRGAMGTVFQEPFLFAGTLRDNIRFGRLEATDAEVEDAARVAHAHEFIARLGEGYDMAIGERGMRLSVGQKQRVALARVALRRPRLLLLDEATSALDAESEERVREGLEALMDGRTSIVVAHRLATVLSADVIVVIDDGRVVAQGPHRELIRSSPLYRRLHDLQFNPPATVGTERTLEWN